MSNTISLTIFFIILAVSKSFNQNKDAYLYSYFINNGSDGLHLAYSLDGYDYSEEENNQEISTGMLFISDSIGQDIRLRVYNASYCSDYFLIKEFKLNK